jgi:hypothetical protein
MLYTQWNLFLETASKCRTQWSVKTGGLLLEVILKTNIHVRQVFYVCGLPKEASTVYIVNIIILQMHVQ